MLVVYVQSNEIIRCEHLMMPQMHKFYLLLARGEWGQFSQANWGQFSQAFPRRLQVASSSAPHERYLALRGTFSSPTSGNRQNATQLRLGQALLIGKSAFWISMNWQISSRLCPLSRGPKTQSFYPFSILSCSFSLRRRLISSITSDPSPEALFTFRAM